MRRVKRKKAVRKVKQNLQKQLNTLWEEVDRAELILKTVQTQLNEIGWLSMVEGGGFS